MYGNFYPNIVLNVHYDLKLLAISLQYLNKGNMLIAGTGFGYLVYKKIFS